MSRDWESVFRNWAEGPSESEQTRAENAERMVRDAIESSEELKARNIRVFTQGSYRNRVNVKKDSDVDIGIVCFDTYFPDYPDDNVKALAEGRVAAQPAVYTYAVFKDEIEEALIAKFGRASVSRGKKSFDIDENSYHVEADVAAFFEHRRYQSGTKYLSGVEMIPDGMTVPNVRNWPEQHYNNGVSKNSQTARRFKRTVRILKSLSNEMSAAGIKSAVAAPSFLIECLVWNAPNPQFNHSDYKSTVRSVLAWLFNNTTSHEKCSDWGEVSDLKYLFKGSQPWSQESSHTWLSDAWDYVGYK